MRSTLPRPNCDQITQSDQLTKHIISNISLPNQHYFRDSGWFRSIINLLASSVLSLYYLSHPTLSLYVHSIKRRYKLIEVSPCVNLHLFLFSNSLKRKNVLLFVHGGAWGSGHPSLYFLITRSLSSLFSSVIFLEYRTYPDSTKIQQVDSTFNAISFIHTHPSLFNLAALNFNIFACGHSSGANLIYSTLCNYPSSSSMITGFISLSGVFDLYNHYLYESSRGVENISPMKPACLDVPQVDENQVTIDTPSLLIHGLCDDTVPFYSSVLVSKQFSNAKLLFVNDCSHMDPVVKLIEPINIICNMIREWIIESKIVESGSINMRSKL